MFWDDDPDYFWAYWDAYINATKRRVEENNINAFNQGQYFLLALAQCLQFTKNPKQIYPKKPLGLSDNKKANLSKKEYEEMRKIELQERIKRFNNK